MSDQLSPEAQDAVNKIQKLLNLAAKNPNRAEAEAAAAKAQELLTRYNLDAALVERAGGAADGRREELKTRGGFYQYQRSLWSAVAELNFCMYWTQEYTVDMSDRNVHRRDGRRIYSQIQKRHRLVGRIVNTTATKVMAGYLEEAIERLTRENVRGDKTQFYSRYAMSFREGMVSSLVRRISERFRERLAEERRKEMAAAEASDREARPQTGASREVSLHSYVKSESDANMDFLYGEGWSAQRAMERAMSAQRRKEEEAAYTAWATANPEAARAKEAERREEDAKWAKRHRYRGGRSSSKDYDVNAYYAGQDAAKSISLDPQAGSRNDLKIGGGS